MFLSVIWGSQMACEGYNFPSLSGSFWFLHRCISFKRTWMSMNIKKLSLLSLYLSSLRKYCIFIAARLRAVLWAVQLVRSHRAPRPATNGIEPPPPRPVTPLQTDRGGPHSIPRTGPASARDGPGKAFCPSLRRNNQTCTVNSSDACGLLRFSSLFPMKKNDKTFHHLRLMKEHCVCCRCCDLAYNLAHIQQWIACDPFSWDGFVKGIGYSSKNETSVVINSLSFLSQTIWPFFTQKDHLRTFTEWFSYTTLVVSLSEGQKNIQAT